jgi:hypothetical protein
MANKYTWTIKKMVAHAQEQGHQNVVYGVDWEQTASTDDDAHSVSTSGTQLLPFTGGDSFAPADQLTQDTVVEWVKSAMGDVVQASIKEQLDALLQEKIQPKTVEVALPWLAS